jgi:hypothetical protein
MPKYHTTAYGLKNLFHICKIKNVKNYYEMTEKQKIIAAFKSLDFEALQNLLDDNRPYMDVSKALFLSRLKEKLDKHQQIKSYENVVIGTCNHCNKGCQAYKFTATGLPSLPLFFEEKDGEVIDIYLCNAFKEDNNNDEDNEWTINLYFYEEEKVNFKPSLQHLINLQRIEKAVQAFNKLETLGLVPMQDLFNWYNCMERLAKDLKLNDVFSFIEFKDFKQIDKLYSAVDRVVSNYNENHLAKSALEAYHKIDLKNEKSVVKWLFDHENIYFFSLKKTTNWRKTGILILETVPNLVLDCSECLDGYIFATLYDKHCKHMIKKYKPTAEHFQQNKDGIEYSLRSHLKLHNKYLDLL